MSLTERSWNWMRQAEADHRQARNSRSPGDFEWACFAVHQAAGKAVKACFQKLHGAIAITAEVIEFCKGILAG